MKQETLEEAADLWATDTKNVHPADSYIAKQSFIQGAKWQAERTYSEAIEFGKWLDENIQQREYYPMSKMTMEELFEEFKKK